MKMEIACVINVRGMTKRKLFTAASVISSATAHHASKHGMSIRTSPPVSKCRQWITLCGWIELIF